MHFSYFCSEVKRIQKMSIICLSYGLFKVHAAEHAKLLHPSYCQGKILYFDFTSWTSMPKSTSVKSAFSQFFLLQPKRYWYLEFKSWNHYTNGWLTQKANTLAYSIEPVTKKAKKYTFFFKKKKENKVCAFKLEVPLQIDDKKTLSHFFFRCRFARSVHNFS